jgi:hypothetical protein
MYSTDAKAFAESGLKCMVRKIPVTNCMTSIRIARLPKKYQKLKFLGV